MAVGTLLLLADEAGTNPAHRAGLTGPDRGDQLTTTAFTGRPAGALRNEFLAAYDGRGTTRLPGPAPPDQPDPQGRGCRGPNPEHVNLWAGTGYRSVRQQPAGEILKGLVP